MTTAVSAPWIVLHADDYGMNAAVNAGILQSFRDGLLTSTSLLANAPQADAACAAWSKLLDDLRAEAIPSVSRRRELGDPLTPFDLGIHLNLTQGRPLSPDYPTELLNEAGQFPGVGGVFRRLRTAGSKFREPVRAELRRQIELMSGAVGRFPSHLNGHQYIEMIPGVAELVPSLMEQYSIGAVRVAREPRLVQTVLARGQVATFLVALIKRHFAGRFRKREASAFPTTDRFFGTAHAGLVTPEILKQFLAAASRSGVTEVGLHPATVCDSPTAPSGDWFDPLASTRPLELKWLCDASTVPLIAGHSLSLGRLSLLARK